MLKRSESAQRPAKTGKKRRTRSLTGRLTRLVLFFMVIVMPFSCTVAVVVAGFVYPYRMSTSGVYQVWNMIRKWPAETLTAQLDTLRGYMNGEVSAEELEALAASEEYTAMRQDMDELLSDYSKMMRDVAIVIVDREALIDQEALKNGTAAPVCYLMESSADESDQHTIGSMDKFRTGVWDALSGHAVDEEMAGLLCGEWLEEYDSQDPGDYYVYSDSNRYLFATRHYDYYAIPLNGQVVGLLYYTFGLDSEASVGRIVTWVILIGGAVVTLLAMVIVYLYVRKKVTRPLRLVEEEAAAFTGNDIAPSERLAAVKTGDELESLAGSILKMEKDIGEYVGNITRITAEKERIDSELKIASQIQTGMLPREFPTRPDFGVYATMTPAKAVGGDFYDFFMIDDSHAALVIADVSGKGIHAALFMVRSRTLIKTRAMMGGTPAEILRDVNEHLCENNTAELFVTVWMAIIDLKTGEGVSVNAGHEHPVLRRAGGDYELVKYRHSPAVAAMEGMRFRERAFRLEKGDRLVVYTDGVAEATNAADELYGTDRMLTALNMCADASIQETVECLRADIDKFVNGAPQFDDITLLIFEYKGC